MTNAQHDTDKMRHEAIMRKAEEFGAYVGLDDNDTPGSEMVMMSPDELVAFVQDYAAQSAATIARLEERAAAAEADNARLREALKPFAALLQEHNSEGADSRPIFGINRATITLGDLREVNAAISRPLSTSALNTHVAKVTAELQAKVDALGWADEMRAVVKFCARGGEHIWHSMAAFDSVSAANAYTDELKTSKSWCYRVVELPPAPDNQKG